MMADDDYLDNPDRGEYDTPVWYGPARIITTEQISAQPFASIADKGYWRKMYAGMAMAAVIQAFPQESSYHHAEYAVADADALIDELKKEKK